MEDLIRTTYKIIGDINLEDMVENLEKLSQQQAMEDLEAKVNFTYSEVKELKV